MKKLTEGGPEPEAGSIAEVNHYQRLRDARARALRSQANSVFPRVAKKIGTTRTTAPPGPVDPEWMSAAGITAHGHAAAEECDECEALIPPGQASVINAYHMPACSLHPEASEERALPPALDEALDTAGVLVPAYGFERGGMFIVNARISDCGRFIAKPSEYGLTDAQADELERLNRGRNLMAYANS